LSFSVKEVSYKYSPESNLALKNVSFEIREGNITAIVGPSGCGKSTLVSILSGVIPNLMPNGVHEGSFEVGKEVNISVVSQSPENQLFGYGVEDAISFGIENMGINYYEIEERIEYVLDLLNIQHLRKRSVSTLSGGQRQAVCIASVLAMKPDILIMDEPVSSLDPNGKKLIQTVLNQLRAAGQTTIIVDNNLDWCSDIIDHVIGLYDGEVIFDGDKNKFYDNFEIQEKLGVTIPQEIEIYRELSKRIEGLNKFYSLADAKSEIGKLVGTKKYNAEIHKFLEKSDEILTAHGICKTFQDDFHALIDVNAAFEKGKVISILGQNGSGKTTFVKHLNGLYSPTRGSIKYKGIETTGKSVAQISKDIILVFQHPEHMLFEETVYRELTFCARAQGVNFSEEEALEVLSEYDLIEYKEELPVNLSMGKKHLLTILSVLFSSAEVIILDEPTLGMDLHLKNKLEDIVLRLTSKGKTVIIISHEIPLVFKISDELLILNEGVKLKQDSKEELSKMDDIFEKINIPLPPVVTLSKYFGFSSTSFDVDSFVQRIIDRMVSQ
jgi:energy-coupling factor transport system ATP-binding protein